MYRLNAEQQVYLDKVKKLTGGMAKRASQVDSEASFPRESIQALAQEGFWGLTISREYGGQGQDYRVMCAVLEEIARSCASTAMIYLMHLNGIAIYNLVPKKTEKYLRAAAAGTHLSTLAFSEFGSRSHFWVPMSQEKREGARAVLNASKSFVTSAGQADGYVTITRWVDAKKPHDSMMYLVLREDAGVSVAGTWSGLGLRGNMSAPMKMENVILAEDRALSESGGGWDIVLNIVLPTFCLGSAAVSVGIAGAAVKATWRHITKSRFEYLDSSLAEIPLERRRLAEMRMETNRARAHLVSALDARDDASPSTALLALEVKAAAGETAVHVTDVGLRACGGTGFSKNIGMERFFRDARASQVMSPTTDLLYEFIARALCGMEML